jgi:hypothetical protein
MPIIGSGTYRYDFQREWAKPPRWWNFGEAGHPGPPQTSVKGATDANGDIYVLCREHAILWGSLRRQCDYLIAVRGTEAGIATTEDVLETYRSAPLFAR